ncbi:ADP-ribosylation factor-like protein 13B isoform X2 [Homarus americanus]|uniref:ADP-ribosylation factor-like protein 13B isoform X2 n=1 Tax=Homarus americanus TaxID=6706 RepID=UPI001C449142|nr:ADP-ribosylation factor-like protein 13B isoform X2 [Homarus americanus]
MGNCLLLLGLKKEKRPVTLLLVGLDNAGKTTAAKSIVGDPVEDVAPTVGFAPENLEYRGCEITIYDLGGGNKIRPVWAKYFSEVHGIIFVVDSSDAVRVRECRDVLFGLLADKKISGKPVLVLANKQDVEGALDEIDLVESLNVEQVVNKYKCPTRVETCSAVTTRKHKPDKPIADGFRWLIDTIVVHYKEINKRVEDDLEKERLQMMKEREERKERIRRLQAERERQEALRLETMSRGKVEAVEVHNSDDSDVEVVDDTQHPGRSGVPNGILPQSRKVEVRKVMKERRSSSVEEQELKELGFTSHMELQESTSSSSSPQGSPPASNSPVRVQASPSPEKEDSPVHCPPTKPHRVIHVQESPKHQAASAQDLTEADSLSNGVRKGDSRFLEANSFYNINGYSASKFDLSHEERTDECVPIDSDDDTCNSSVSSHRRESTSPFTVHTSSNPSILSYSKAEQLELETTYKPSKKKSFLKRYHKTAPFIPNGSASTAGNQEVNHSSRVPPSLS